MATTDPQAVVLQFNACINQQDLSGLGDLMTIDHVFIDSANNRLTGIERCKAAWKGFFDAFPDYQNHIEAVQVTRDQVAIAGYSTCADRRLGGPALWLARIRGGKISEWRIFEDIPENRQFLGLD